MKPFLLFLFLLIGFNSFSQKCKYEMNEVDKFTKERVVITKSQLLQGNTYFSLDVKASKIEDNVFFTFGLMTTSIVSFEKGSEVMFLDNEENLYSFKIVKDEIANGVATSVGNYWTSSIMTVYEGDISEIQGLIVRDVRIETADSFIEKSIKEKRGDAVSNVLNCVLNVSR